MKWLDILKVLGPAVLATVPGAQVIIPLIVAGIQIAEISGEPGPKKKLIAMEAVKAGVASANSVAKREVISVDEASQLADNTIDAVVGAVNIISKIKTGK